MSYYLQKEDDGPLKIWEHPYPHIQYCMGIDTSTGLSQDYTSMQVFTRTYPYKQSAHFRAKLPVIDAGEMANMLGRYYNEALVVCEINYPGNAVQDALIQTYFYPKNYRAEEHLDSDPSVSAKYGFQTTQAKKWLIIRETQELMVEGGVEISCEQTIEEMGNFVYIEDNTKTGGAPGFNDDTVIALMLALHGCMTYPQAIRKPKVKRETDPDKAQAQLMMKEFMNKLKARGTGREEPQVA